jgi:hypothetical protein
MAPLFIGILATTWSLQSENELNCLSAYPTVLPSLALILSAPGICQLQPAPSTERQISVKRAADAGGQSGSELSSSYLVIVRYKADMTMLDTQWAEFFSIPVELRRIILRCVPIKCHLVSE